MKTVKGLTQDNKDALKFVLENATTKTVTTIKDLRLIDKVCKVIESSTDTLELEDTDYEYLKKRYEAFDQWNPAVRQIVLDTADKLNG
jgi:hypothetical protein